MAETLTGGGERESRNDGPLRCATDVRHSTLIQDYVEGGRRVQDVELFVRSLYVRKIRHMWVYMPTLSAPPSLAELTRRFTRGPCVLVTERGYRQSRILSLGSGALTLSLNLMRHDSRFHFLI